jgi:hypothetical protein
LPCFAVSMLNVYEIYFALSWMWLQLWLANPKDSTSGSVIAGEVLLPEYFMTDYTFDNALDREVFPQLELKLVFDNLSNSIIENISSYQIRRWIGKEFLIQYGL